MALSSKTLNTLVDALSNKSAATELVSLVTARSGKPSRVLTQCMVDAMAGKTTGNEVLAALTSGANLSSAARKKILIMMAGDATPTGYVHAAGNELINYIQTTPQTSNTTL